MPWTWLFASLAFAGPRPLVAIGDGLVVGAPTEVVASAEEAEDAAPATMAALEPAVHAARARPTVAGGWVAILADCLEERSPGAYVVLDRSAEGQDAETTRRDVAAVKELAPSLVLVGVGVPGDADRRSFRAGLQGLVADLRAGDGPEVLLVGLIPPTLSQLPDASEVQAAADRRTRTWDGEVAAVADADLGVHHVALLATWPESAEEREALTVEGTRLSDQGHARVAAQVCDAVIAWDASASE